jgi:AraC-like DNA-binding protein
MGQLSEVLRAKLIPWSRHDADERFIVARPKMSVAEMPDGVILKRRKLTGPRVIVKDKRLYGNMRGICAEWPQDGMHEWEGHKMICVLAGRMSFQAGNYSIECGEGYHLILPPGTPQRPCYLEGYYCEILHVILHFNAVQCFFRRSQPSRKEEHGENYLFKNSKLVLIFQALMEEMIDGEGQYQQTGADLLAAFWTILQREVEAQRYINPGRMRQSESAPEKSASFEADLLAYIQTHLDKSPTLESVARGMHLSRSQFVRRIREETGKTFVQFLTDCRIAEAKVLLRDSDWTGAAIAEILGFATDHYFLEVFRRATGKTPGQYRKEIRKIG